MVTMFKPKPQLMRSVAKPDNVSTKELAEARPVYIDGLPEGGGGGGSSTTDAITLSGITGYMPDGTPLNLYLTTIVEDINGIASQIEALQGSLGALESRVMDLESADA